MRRPSPPPVEPRAPRPGWRPASHRPDPACAQPADLGCPRPEFELLVRTVSKLRRALRLTYPFVFVDKFQDTTVAQFSFLTSVFGGAAVTAVGDRKQRIMGFAGALPNALEHFTTTFQASRYDLSWNFIQRRPRPVATTRDRQQAGPARRAGGVEGRRRNRARPGRTVGVLRCRSGGHLHRRLDRPRHRPIPPRTCGLRPGRPAEDRPVRRPVRGRLAAHGIGLRNDDAMVGTMRLQDLLKNEIARLLLGLLRSPPSRVDWPRCGGRCRPP